MTTLNMTVTTRKMPHTSEFFAIGKAVEHFYYALLFTEIEYDNVLGRWSSWQTMGFSNAIKDPPPDSDEIDRLRRSVFSNGKVTQITFTSRRRQLLETLAEIITDIDAAKVDEQIVVPVTASLRESGASTHDVAAFEEVIERGLKALTHRDIVSIAISTAPDAEAAAASSGAARP